jgi:hypothetical protein
MDDRTNGDPARQAQKHDLSHDKNASHPARRRKECEMSLLQRYCFKQHTLHDGPELAKQVIESLSRTVENSSFAIRF